MYLRAILCHFGIFQGLVHLYLDYDNTEAARQDDDAILDSGSEPAKQNAYVQLANSLPYIIKTTLPRSTIMTATGTISYFIFFRRILWRWAYAILGSVYTLAKSSGPSRYPRLGNLLYHSLIAGSLLIFLWEVSNKAFTLCTYQRPLKRGLLLTEDSRDPNGSLLSGLKARNPITKVPIPLKRFSMTICTNGTIENGGLGAFDNHAGVSYTSKVLVY